MVSAGNAYQAGDKLTFDEKLIFLRDRNLSYFLEEVYPSLLQSNPLVKGSGKSKAINQIKVKEYKTAFGQLFKYMFDFKCDVIARYGEKTQEHENVYTLLNSVIEINQQLPQITHELVVKKSLFRKKSNKIPAVTVKSNMVKTIKLYEVVLQALCL